MMNLRAIPRPVAYAFLALVLASLGALLAPSTGSARATWLAQSGHMSADPLAAESLYVRSGTPADVSEAGYQAQHDTHDANLMAKIAHHPVAIWLTGEPGDLPSLQYTVRAARAAHQEVVVVLYDLPGRDCGSYSSGGAPSPGAYRQWVSTMAAGLGSVRAAVVIEPDALSEQTCWPNAERASNLSLIRYAATTMAALPGTSVYLDAGNPLWIPASVMAARLRQADVADVRGFAVDTASFTLTSAGTRYGDAISRDVDHKPFVIDTSRSGRGPLFVDGKLDWCNPPGRGLGPSPTTSTGNPLIDAYLWLKIPGASDGPCNGGPSSGDWWPAYALGLAARAG